MKSCFLLFAAIIFSISTGYCGDSLHKEFKQFYKNFKKAKGWHVIKNHEPILKNYFFNKQDSALAQHQVLNLDTRENTRYFFIANQLVWVFSFDNKKGKKLSEYHRAIYHFKNGALLKKEEHLYQRDIDQLLKEAEGILSEAATILATHK